MKNYNKYLSISDLEFKWGFYVTAAGFSKIDIYQSYPDNSKHPRTHTFNWEKGRILNDYYLVYIPAGKGVFEISDKPVYDICEGYCFILYPGTWHRYRPDPQYGWQEYWIGFNGIYAEQILSQFFDAQNPVINTQNNEDMERLFRSVLSLLRTPSTGYHQQIAGITYQILGVLNTFSVKSEQHLSPAEKLINEFKFLLKENLNETKKIEELVINLPASYSKLRKSFKIITGVSPNQYQLNLKLKKAKELLTTTNLSVSEIAGQTGFDSIYYLSKIFKKKFSASPENYRKSYIATISNGKTIS